MRSASADLIASSRARFAQEWLEFSRGSRKRASLFV